PLVEMVLALLLLLPLTAWCGALGAAALLALFLAGMGRSMIRGEAPDCHCFGQIHSEPVGWPTIARNGGLLVVALVAASPGPRQTAPGIADWTSHLTTGETVLAFLILGVAVLVVGQWIVILETVRQNGRLLVRLDTLVTTLAEGGAVVSGPRPASVAPPAGPPVGSSAPAFALPDLSGQTVALETILATDRPAMLVFTSPDCAPCNALMPDLGRWQAEYSEDLAITIISRGTVEENRKKSAEHGLQNILLQELRELEMAYGVNGTPSAVVIETDGRIVSELATGADAMLRLLNRALSGLLVAPATATQLVPLLPELPRNGSVPAAPAALTLVVGNPAPALALPDLDGNLQTLFDFAGEEIMLLFWANTCGFCTDILPDLHRWQTRAPAGSPRLVLIASGTAEENRAANLPGAVLLDQHFLTGHAYGATGTPSAVRIDRDGKIASELVAGIPLVLALLGGGSFSVV
ncbi:MAG: TlpA family protein disulfide reductase, partial [Chloroflexota bacterium]|nr:TlpA family protein disulfide reductase [Chloroflexota bacterium]